MTMFERSRYLVDTLFVMIRCFIFLKYSSDVHEKAFESLKLLRNAPDGVLSDDVS
jgi:hypothetical protein